MCLQMWTADIFRVRASEPGLGGDIEYAQAFVIGTKDAVLEALLQDEVKWFDAVVYEIADHSDACDPVYLVPNDERFA